MTSRRDHSQIRVRPQPAADRDGWLRASAVIEGLPGGDTELWFDFEPRHRALLTSRADPWLLALLFPAMRSGSTLHVDGEVSRDLLTSLEAFQATWRLWFPEQYQPVTLQATGEVADRVRPPGDARSALVVFDGGLHDCYTAYRHVRQLAGRQTLRLRAGLVVLGLPAREDGGGGASIGDARALLGDLGLDLWIVRTNAASVVPTWAHASGAVRASCLHWFGGGLGVGVLPATGTVTRLSVRSGSHPLTDPWLGTTRMRIVHDGAELDQAGKAAVLAAWPAAARQRRAGPKVSHAGRTASSANDGAAVRTGPSPGAAFVWAARPQAARIHVFPEAPAVVDDRVVLEARVEGLGDGQRSLWFSTGARHAPHLTALADPFVCALQFPAMRAGAALVIHGPVSRLLLENLERFQQAWHAWAPAHVTPIAMQADREVEGASPGGDTLVLFSGGLDSSFSVYRHRHGLVGRRSQRIAAGLMVLGFDIPHAETHEFRAALENSRRMLESLDIDLWDMATNFRDIVEDWEPGHGTGIAAAAHCFAGRIDTALVASTASVASLGGPWGTHALTDRLLSSDRLRVMTDGEDVRGRLDKAALVAEWPEAMARLRVCYESARRDRNCGACPKCVMTALLFIGSGLARPATLPSPDPERVRRLPLRAPWEARVAQRLLARAQEIGVAEKPELLALQECLRWNHARWHHPGTNAPSRETIWGRARRRLAGRLRQWSGYPAGDSRA